MSVDPSPPNSDDRLLRATEIQRELGVSRATAYRMMADGTLPIYRFGGRGGQRTMNPRVPPGPSRLDRRAPNTVSGCRLDPTC
jgi:excisionase family DNA binding protein